ncbi:hypothetical protein L7F22_052902 [Adiantum nelumboides]|nr:hypothetical protein [Adiantum nelumboides]
MGGRFDPVRDSVTRSPSSDDRRSASISEDMAAHRRQTNRSASIAEILNEGGQESAIARSNSGNGYSDHSISHSGQRVPSPMQYNAGSGHAYRNVSSPRSSISRYPDGPPGPAALSQRTSPRGSIIDLPSRERMPSYGRIHDPPPNTYVRQSSPTSMNPYHHQPSTSNVHPVPTLRTERSPSLHHILGPTSSMDEIRRPSSSSSSNTGLGPPYVSNQPSVSPVMGRHSRLSGEHIPGPSHLRADSMEMHPHHSHSGHYTGHSSSIRASSSSGSGGEFAVPDVPYRSPESMRGRVPLPPTVGPPLAHGSSPYGHPVRSSPLGVPARYPEQEGYGRPIPTDFLDDRYGGARPATPPSLPDARGHIAYQPYDRVHPPQQLHINTDHGTYHAPQTPPVGVPQTPYSSIAAQSPGRPPMTPGGFAPTPGEYMGTPFFGREKHVHMHSHSSSIGTQQAMDAEEHEYRQRQMYQQHERRASRDPMMEERARFEHERATYERTKVFEEEQMHARRMQEIREREDYEAHQRLLAQEEQANILEQTRLARETEEQSKADSQLESRQASPPPKKRKSAASKNEKKQSALESNSKEAQSVPEALVENEGAEGSNKAESTKEVTNTNGSSSTEKKTKKNSVQTLPMDLKKPSEFASKKSAPTPIVKEDIREPEIVEIRKPSYKPSHRVSLPGTVRLPIILTELERLRIQCKNSLRQKWQEDNAGRSDGWDAMIAEIEASRSKIVDSITDQTKKRKRNTTESSTTDKGEKENHATGNGNANSLVAAHYNARQDAGRDARKQSPIIDLKTFNNWVKSVLIQQHGKKGGRVFDIGGGKGGDLKKWDKCGIRELILADIAEVSVSQAKDRFMDQRHRYKADFFAMDCFGEPVENHVPEHLLSPLFDTVSLQFCLHYGWDNYSHANLMLDNIAKYLRSGGTFIATFPDCYELHSRLTQAVVRDPTAKSFGNAFYNVSFDEVNRSEDDHIQFEPFGQRYTFALTDAIDEVAEFVVDWRELEEMARQKGLRCIYHGNFANFWQEFGLQGGPFRNLADRFGIRINQEIPMNEDLWGAVTIYAAVAFVKE